MDLTGFREYLVSRGLESMVIEDHVAIVTEFNSYMQGLDPAQDLDSASSQDALEFVCMLIAQQRNTFDNIVALCRYGYFSKNDDVFVTLMELLDGSEAIGNLYERLASEFGAAMRAQVFEDNEPPPLGMPNLDKARLARALISRLESAIGDAACSRFLGAGLRDLNDEWYENDKSKFQECGDIDSFLTLKRQETISLLQKLHDEGKPYFTQPVTEAVIDYVRNDPEVSIGVRDGNILYVTKIPYMTQRFLEAQSETERRYNYCHCPWVRELLLTGEPQVPGIFCNCSGGFHKKQWEVIFGQPLEVEVLESILMGDKRCRFAIHLPEAVVD